MTCAVPIRGRDLKSQINASTQLISTLESFRRGDVKAIEKSRVMPLILTRVHFGFKATLFANRLVPTDTFLNITWVEKCLRSEIVLKSYASFRPYQQLDMICTGERDGFEPGLTPVEAKIIGGGSMRRAAPRHFDRYGFHTTSSAELCADIK
ncbi:unnamed protein product, partial [Iphiclides podalirius]